MSIPTQGPAPDFTLPDEEGQLHSLADYLGKPVVLYFYPRDDTPGCTKEACGFRDDYSAYEEAGGHCRQDVDQVSDERVCKISQEST